MAGVLSNASKSLKSNLVTKDARSGAGANNGPASDKPHVAPKKGGKKAPQEVISSIVSSEDAVEYNPENIPAGSQSGSIAFVCSLGDPSVPDRPKFKDGDKEIPRVYSRIIGYRFKALEDGVRIPDFGTTERFNGQRLNNAKDVNQWKTVAKGEEFDLTRVEVGALLSQPGFNMVANGGEIPVRLQVAFARIKTDQPTNAEDLPSFALTLADNKGSIKDHPIIDVLDYTPAENKGSNKMAQGTRVCKPDFKGTKWEVRALDRKKHPIKSRNASRKKSNANTQDMSVATQTLFARLAASQNKGAE